MAYNPTSYRHELDQRAFEALSAFPKFVQLRESYIANVDEKAAKIDFLSSSIRLSENQFPEIYNLLPPICEKLGIVVPELYYVKSKEMNAATCGNTNPYIYVTSALVEKMPPEMIASVLAHECGHIACKHYLYHSMAGQLINGIDSSPLARIPAISKLLTPTLVKALLFWDRCSELSADRAAVLCDGTADKTVDVLLKIHGYENINREEFLRQAMDLKAFISDSKSNRLMEQMLVQNESHPRLATRAYECYTWANTEDFPKILDGTYTVERKVEIPTDSKEVVSAEVSISAESPEKMIDVDDLNKELHRVNAELDRYTSKADMADYAFAVFSGIMAGAIDCLFVGETKITDGDIQLSHQQINKFIQQYASNRGFDRERLKDSIADLEKAFKVAQDNIWKGAGIGVSAKNHHLADLAHHPTPLGLAASVVVQFLRIGTFVNKDGEWHFMLVETTAKDIVEILAPAVLTGILNWLVFAAEKKYEAEDHEISPALHKLVHLIASTPILIEFAKCADNWFGHLVSDMGGSKNTAGGGMGIPGVFISLLYEFASLPGLRNTNLPMIVNELYEKQKIDLRHELPLYKELGKQAIPVVFIELYVRIGFFLTRLAMEFAEHKNLSDVNWNTVIPFHNRTVDRMLAVSNMTFTFADTADAAIHAALESGGNWVLFSGKFVTRFNYVGAGRAAIAIVKEVSNEHKESQLIHEKMILSEAKTAIFLTQLQEFKEQLEEKVSNYLAEDIEAFIQGFDYMDQGIASGDSNLVIKGNVIIQKVLGRKAQFENQEEFDDLMLSDIPLVL